MGILNAIRRLLRPSQSSSLVGCWHLVRTQGPSGLEEGAEIDILEDGRMSYAIPSNDKWQIMKLTYRVNGDMLITDQGSSPREERTRFVFEGTDTLVLDYGDTRSWFRRGPKRAPAV